MSIRKSMAAALATVGVVATSVLAMGLPARSDPAPPVSPLLWGENLELEAGSLNSDWFLSQPALRAGLAAAHTQIIRIPVRGPSPTQPGIANRAEFQQAVRDVADLGMTPLVILRSPNDPELATDDTDAIQFVNSVFGGRPVYYEWGNESDLTGQAAYVPPEKYVASWNATVPQLKTLAGPGATFMGPAGFQLQATDSGLSYLRTFLAGAVPKPDAVSWHEYTCNDQAQSKSDCLAAIDHWQNHITAAKSLMTQYVGKELPIWITEWNYTPDIAAGDDKHTDAEFLRQWTTKAMQTLAALGVAGSMHFDVRDQVGNSLPLVNGDGSLAPEGVSFKAAYESLTGGTPPPTTTTTEPTTTTTAPTPPPTSLRYSFEDGTLDGWSPTGHVSSLTNSTEAGGQDGTHALKVVFTSTGSGDLPYIKVTPADGPAAGQTLTAYVRLPADGTSSVTAKLFVQDSSGNWYSQSDTRISRRDAWVPLTFTPSGYSGNARRVGLQFLETPANTPTTVYVDSVNWSS